MAGHVTTLTGLVPCARRIRCTGEAKNNNARHCRNSCRIFENKIMLHDLSPISPAKLLYVLSYSHRCAIPYAHAQRHKAKSKKSPAAAREIGMGFAEDHAAMRHQQAQSREVLIIITTTTLCFLSVRAPGRAMLEPGFPVFRFGLIELTFSRLNYADYAATSQVDKNRISRHA
jgi:hypothetical protein